jgi:hypothetical protein
VKSDHIDLRVNDDFYKWCKNKYGNSEVGHVKVICGPKHDNLAILLDYSVQGKLKVNMEYYINAMIEEFPHKTKPVKTTPWNKKLFKIDEDSRKLDDNRKTILHTFVMTAMFLCKQARPDITTAIGFLFSQVKDLNEGHWDKFVRVIGFLKHTKGDILTLEADNTQTSTWYFHAAFAVHPDMRSHTGATFTLGKGAIVSG